MFKNYFKMIFRSWQKDKTTTLINIFGLAFSLMVVLMLAVYIIPELQVDKFHKNLDHIYGIFYSHSSDPEQINTRSPVMLAELLEEMIPGILETVRMKDPWEKAVLSYDNQEPLKTDLLYVDASFFNIFTYESISGHLNTALVNPMSLVLTDDEAHKLFGDLDPVGEIVRFDNKYDLTVTAVIKKPFSQSTLKFNGLVSLNSLNTIEPYSMQANWGTNNFTTFALLRENADLARISEMSKTILPQEKKWYRQIQFNYYPFQSLYFHFNKSEWNLFHHGSLLQVRIFMLILGLILFVALVNFINLSVAKSNLRNRETGIIKTIGGETKHILFRFIIESLILVLFSLGVAVILVQIFVPVLASWMELPIQTNLLKSPLFLSWAGFLMCLVGVLTGVILGVRFAGISPGAVLQRKSISRPDKKHASRILFALQFTIAIVLMISTFVITQQIQFGNRDWGVHTANVIGIKISKQLKRQKEILKNEMMQINGIRQVVFSQFHPGSRNSQWGTKIQTTDEERYVHFQLLGSEPGVFDLLGIELVQGRFFSNENNGDYGKVVINETAVREFNLQNPLNAKIMDVFGEWMEIVGVIKDFHYKPKHEKITPLVIVYKDWASWCYVKSEATSFSQLHDQLKMIKSTVKQLAPAFPVEIEFMDESILRLYQSELRFQKQFLFFAMSAIVLSCMGLLGLTIFAAQHRTKEIGIRKVLGASISGIVTVLSIEFLRWVVLANLIAWPIAWFAMNRWLQNFAYRIDLTIWPFLLAGLTALVIALLTVSWQAVRAAVANPVEALKYE